MVRPVFATSLKLEARLAVRVLESSQSSAEVVEVKSAFQVSHRVPYRRQSLASEARTQNYGRTTQIFSLKVSYLSE